MPTLEKLYKQDPESLPFRQPVDPVLLQIPVSSTYWHSTQQYLVVVYLTFSCFFFLTLVSPGVIRHIFFIV